eukprot:11765791-Prorocentrum_lima.AAC.1
MKCPDMFFTEHFDQARKSMKVRASLTELAHAISRLDTTLASHRSSFPGMTECEEGTSPSLSLTQGNVTPDAGPLVLGALDNSTAAECYYASSSGTEAPIASVLPADVPSAMQVPVQEKLFLPAKRAYPGLRVPSSTPVVADWTY